MPSLKLERFAGLRPRLDPRLLPDEYAQEAHQTKLVDGSLGSMRGLRSVSDATNVSTIVRMPDAGGACGELLTFDHCASVLDFPAPGTIADLDHFVVFHHNGEEPQRYFPARGLWAPIIVPAPTTQLKLTKISSTTLDSEPYRGPDQRAYTYTWVDQFGVESPPAPPSKVVRSWDDEVWELSNFSAPPPNAVALRIYRTAASFDTGEQASNPFDTSFQLLREIELPFTEPFVDDIRGKDLELGTLLTSWDQPPPDMEQVVGTEAGYLVGFRGNDIWISERYEAHHWPERYRINLPDRIIALVANGDWVFVVTTGHAYRFRPEFMVENSETDMKADVGRYPEPWPGMGRMAVCWAPWGALYVSRHGLVAMSPDRLRLITPQRIEIDDWQNWMPNIMAWHKGRLYAWRSPVGRGFVLDLPESGEELDPGDLVTLDAVGARAIHTGRDGYLYVANDAGVHIVEEGDWLPWRWKSKKFEMPGLHRYRAAKLEATGTVTVRLLLDGAVAWQHTFVDGGTVRMPMLRRGVWFEIEMEGVGGATVRSLHFATSLSELAER